MSETKFWFRPDAQSWCLEEVDWEGRSVGARHAPGQRLALARSVQASMGRDFFPFRLRISETGEWSMTPENRRGEHCAGHWLLEDESVVFVVDSGALPVAYDPDSRGRVRALRGPSRLMFPLCGGNLMQVAFLPMGVRAVRWLEGLGRKDRRS